MLSCDNQDVNTLKILIGLFFRFIPKDAGLVVV